MSQTNRPDAGLERRRSTPAPRQCETHPHSRAGLDPFPRALCVDRDPETREALKLALEGYEIVFASGADEAMRSINAGHFDLYIIEYWLSDWTGVGLCRHIRKMDPHVPVCFCTAAQGEQPRQRAERAGGTAFFLKPADPVLMRGEIAIPMQLRALRRETARKAASAALAEEIQKRAAALAVESSRASAERVLLRVGRKRACEAFLREGGTLRAFERSWDELWRLAGLRSPDALVQTGNDGASEV